MPAAPLPASTTDEVRERIAKGDGKFYSARKPVTFEPLGDGEEFALVVLRTHDEARYRDRAADLWGQYRTGPLPVAQQVWVRLVPWDATGAYPFSYQWVEPGVRGAVPALWFED